MNITNTFLACLLFLLPSLVISDEEHSVLKEFPEVKNGMHRFVIMLPHKERAEENDFKVELIAGKIMQTDGVNIVRLGTSFEARILEGWGYTYYKVVGKDVAMSTLMAAPGGSPKVDQFVSGHSLLIKYSSRLPIVVYAPHEHTIKYRIWSAQNTTENAEKK